MLIQNLDGCHLKTKLSLRIDVLERFRKTYNGGELPPLALAEKTDDINTYQQAIDPFLKLEDVLILGTGGSSLGGQALYALSTQKKPRLDLPRLHFLDNVDPHTFERLFTTISPKATGLIAISKSGSTVETLMQLLTCVQRGITEQVLVVTEPTDNPLRKLANKQKWLCLDHPTTVGGRYSCFSVVGLIPMLLSGLDPYGYRKGAASVLQAHLTESEPPALLGAQTAHALKEMGKTLSVMMPYADQLRLFALWYCQLWAESLGKEGKGTTPVAALGTVDQHSQLQLYLAGPKDKFFTLIAPRWEERGDKINSPLIPEFTHKTMGDLFSAELKATYETLKRNHCPVRLITLDKIGEESLGALMMHFMIETILTSYLEGVNAFDQPAVEEGKILAREYLAA
ncbi:MAG: glucose-6-phosphate isomerase [Alphaproteobacteria bacterium]|nr:glucose-6-phosphate isomerase [Alphaproteobacteria bacterium]